jgi:hypothetical protein
MMCPECTQLLLLPGAVAVSLQLLLLQLAWTAAPKTERARGISRLVRCWLVHAAPAAAAAAPLTLQSVLAADAAAAAAAAAAVPVLALQQVGQLQVAVGMS